MKIISVDIALRKSGLVVLDGSGRVEQNKVLKVSAKLSRTDSLKSLYYALNEFYVSLMKSDPSEEYVLVMEDVMVFGHLKAAVAIESARTSSMLAYHLACKGLGLNERILYATPAEVKSFFTKKRGAKKDELFTEMFNRYPQYRELDLVEDEKDALALALYAKHKQLDLG